MNGETPVNRTVSAKLYSVENSNVHNHSERGVGIWWMNVHVRIFDLTVCLSIVCSGATLLEGPACLLDYAHTYIEGAHCAYQCQLHYHTFTGIVYTYFT